MSEDSIDTILSGFFSRSQLPALRDGKESQDAHEYNYRGLPTATTKSIDENGYGPEQQWHHYERCR